MTGNHVLVIGGGIGAVTAAAALGQKGLAVTLIECSDGSGVTDLRLRQNIPTIKN